MISKSDVPEAGEVLARTKDEFVSQWGALGSSWGINRTMAQIHALLMIGLNPLTTDEVMEDLKISRGNAHMNLRELVGWGLVRSVIRKGDRKEYFEAEKDVWKIFCIVARERKRREVDPAFEVLKSCADRTKGLKSSEGKTFHGQMSDLCQIVSLVSSILDKAAKNEQSQVMPWMLKFIK